jgi:acyl-CoA thioester hydrolase
VTLVAAGLSEDGSRFRLRNEFYREGGALAARVTSTGGWLDLKARKMVIPPDELKALLDSLPRTADYEPLRSAVTKAL